MNVYYKIMELSKLINDLQAQNSQSTSDIMSTGIIIAAAVIILLALLALTKVLDSDTISVIKMITLGVAVIVFIMTVITVATIMLTKLSTEFKNNANAENKMQKERYEKEILKLYNENKDMFTNKNLTNVNDIIKEADSRKASFENEVNISINKISNTLQENKIYLEQEKIQPFAELYAMDKDKIPVTSKVEQKVSPDEAGKICNMLEIKDCFNNSAFTEYNKDKMGQNENISFAQDQENYFKVGFMLALCIFIFSMIWSF